VIDLKAFLEQQQQVVAADAPEREGLTILPARHRLLAKAKGAIRQHLEMQLAEALRRFEDGLPPQNDREIS
jgi:hypothetical protein